MSFRKFFAVVAFCILSLTCAAADWPQWLGPNRDGISKETGLLQSWPAGGPLLVWKATGLGGGYVSPSVAAGRVYGSGYRAGDEVVWALDAQNGKEIWATKVAPASKQFQYSEGPRATPTVDGDLVFTLGGVGNLACLETKAGKVLWTRSFTKDFDGKLMSGWGFSESPLVDGENLICTPGSPNGTVVALNKKTGELVWQSKGLADVAAYSSLVPAEIGGVRQYVVLTAQNVAGISAKDGAVLWQARRPGRTAVIPTPIVHDNLIWVTSGYGVGCNLFRVTPGNPFKVEEVYANKGIVNHHGGAVLVSDHVYATTDTMLVSMELATGKVAWSERSVGKGSIAYADGNLYVRSENGPVALVEATAKGYVEKGRFNQPDRSSQKAWPHPVISGGRLYLRDMDILLCYDIRKK